MYICIYIYIYIEREREIDIHVYIYIYIYTCVYVYRGLQRGPADGPALRHEASRSFSLLWYILY